MNEPGSADGPDPDLIVYADYVCPFCYCSEVVLEPLRAEGLHVESRPFELWPAPTRLPSMEQPYFREAWERNVIPLADRLGVRGMKRPHFATRTRKAHEAAAFARRHGAGPAMHRSLYDAYFLEAQDIGRVDVLVDIGAGIGLDRSALKVALDIDQYTEAVVALEQEAHRLGITAVPAHLASGDDRRFRLMTGAHDSDALRALLAAASSTRSPGEDE